MTVPSWWECLDCEVGWHGDPCCPHCARTVTTHDGLCALVVPPKDTWTSEVPEARRWTR